MGSPKKRIQYRYDAVGNRIGMTDPDGGRFTYAYDAVNRITQVINPQGDRTSYGYDAGGRRTVKKLANGTRASFSYDAASNLTRLANLKSDGTTISSFDYDYDRVGNRTAVLEADASRVTWSYDDTYQLTGEHRTGSHAYRNTFAYDPAGNRTLKNEDGARTTYAYDAANQLEWSEDASGRMTYTFDADGNQQLIVEPSGDRTSTSWDFENRTTLVQLPSGIRNTMAYEPGGLRVKLDESTGTKKFVWDDQNYLAETDESDDTRVVYTNEPRVYGNLVSQRRGTDSHWYHFDAIGSTRELTDSGEAVTDTRLYDAWGQTVSFNGAVEIRQAFLGQLGYFLDFDSGAIYVRRRILNPSCGCWTSVDAVFDTRRGRLPYVYVFNRPLVFADPSGLEPPTWQHDDEDDLFRKVQQMIYESMEEPPLPQLPCPPLGLQIPCDEQPTWHESFCESYDPRCRCDDTAAGRRRPPWPATFPHEGLWQKWFDNARLEVGIPVNCNVFLVVQQICVEGFPNHAVTCDVDPHNIIICVPASQQLNQCQAEALVLHEMEHAHQFCSGTWDNLDFDGRERPAYTRQCNLRADQLCLKEGSQERADYLAQCINPQVSNIPDGKSKRNKACAAAQERLRQEVFENILYPLVRMMTTAW